MRLFRSLDSGAPGWQNEPWLALQHRLVFDEHVMPMWDPNDGYGVPFAASMAAQPFYPPTFAASVEPTPWTYNLLVIGRLFIVGLGCALFVRLFGGFVPAFIAGICGAFSGYFLVYADICHIGVEVMLPWILLGVELVIRRAGPRSAAVLAGAWAVSLFGGMPESSALASIVYGLYAVARIAMEWSDRQTPKRIVWLVSGIGVGTAMAGIVMVPFIEYLQEDLDQHQTRPQGLDFDPFAIRLLLTEFAPLAFGPPVNYIATAFNGFSGFRGGPGTFAIFLATLGATSAVSGWRRRNRSDRVALLLVLIGVGFEAKRFGLPLVQWIGALPLIGLSNFPKYGEADIAVCFACAAGLGVAAVAERRVSFVQLGSAFAIVLAGLTWLYTGVVLPPSTKHELFFYFAMALSLGVLGLSAAVIWSATRTTQSNRIAAMLAGVAILESAFAYFVPIFYLIDKPASDARNPYRPAPYIDYLQRATAQNRGRVMATGEMLYPNWSSAFDLDDPRNLSPMYPGRYLHFIDAFVEREPQTADDQFDRFTGSRPIDFDDPLVRRWVTLSSIEYIVSSHTVPPIPDNHAILSDLWNQNRGAIPPARAPAVHPTTAEIGGVAENALFDHPPDNTIAYASTVPASLPWFAVDISLDPAVFIDTCGGPVSFGLDARNAAGESIANAFTTIDPHSRVADRRWHRMTLDLRRAAGKPISLHFATSVPPPGDLSCAWALWGEPRWTPVIDLRPYKNSDHNGFTRVASVTDAVVYHVNRPFPRLTLVHHVKPAATGAEALAIISKSPFDAQNSVVVEGDAPPANGSGVGDRVSLIERASQRLVADVDTRSAAVLLQNDTWYPGWTATVDGIETPIMRADFLFRGIPISPGRHRVVIAYRSRAVLIGLILSLLGLLTFAAMLSSTPALRDSLARIRGPAYGFTRGK